MKNILVIEDNADLRENIAEVLELKGYMVNTAKDGNEGMGMIKNLRPDVIIFDSVRTDNDILNFIYRIVNDTLYKGIEFIFLSTGYIPAKLKDIIEVAIQHLVKPFSAEELLHAVEHPGLFKS